MTLAGRNSRRGAGAGIVPSRPKVLFIGLDGATFQLLNPLLAAGLMPRLKGLIESGTHGELETLFPPITPVAWVSWMTGKNPGKHGVFEFLQRSRSGGHDQPVGANARDGAPFWDLLARHGKRSIVTNVPCTYPPRIANGVLIADFLTPRGRRDFTAPPGLLDELESRFGPYPLYLTEVYSPGNVDPILDQLFEELEYKTKVNRFLMASREWDLFVTHYWGTDRFQHELWHLLDPSHPLHSAAEAQTHGTRAREYWGKVDETLGLLIDDVGEGTTVLVGSDHGFGPIRKFLCFNYWLLEEGLLTLKRNPWTRLKATLFRLGLTPELLYRLAMKLGLARLRLSMGVTDRSKLQRLANALMLSLEDVDWARTAVFSKGNYGQMHVNLKGRERDGAVEPGEAFRRVVDDLTARLRALKDPETGEPLIGPVWLGRELYQGPHTDLAPDIQFLPRDMSNKALGTLDLTSNRFISPVFGNSGDHRMEGILIGSGPGIRRGLRVEGAKLIDVAPTILHLMGSPVPRDMDGRVIDEMLSVDFLSRNPVRHSDPVDFPAGEGHDELTDAEKEEIKSRLKSLGYLG